MFIQSGIAVTPPSHKVGITSTRFCNFVDANEVIAEGIASVSLGHFVIAYRVGVWVIIHT